MNKGRWISLLALSGLIFSILTTVAYSSPSLRVLANPGSPAQDDVCYAVADNNDGNDQDVLARVDFETGALAVIGFTGTYNVEAMTFEPGTNLLFGADENRLGTFSAETAAFTPYSSAFGSGTGSEGLIAFDDVDGIAFDPTTGLLYGILRRRAATDPDPDDILFQINLVTGALAPGAFSAGEDYVVIKSVLAQFHDIDDITVDPTTGQMYGIADNGGTGDALVKIDKFTGIETFVGFLGVDDMEGLTFDPEGRLEGTTGKSSNTDPGTGTDNSNRIFRIDKDTGAADNATSKSLVQTTVPLFPFDYEAVECLSSPAVDTPTPTPTFTPIPTNTPTPTVTPTPTATPTQPTAVELLYFRAELADGDQVILSWSTASEIGTYGFNLYRSSDGSRDHAVLAGFEPARGGIAETRYEYRDPLPSKGLYYYWLEEVVNGDGKVNVRTIAEAAAIRRVYVPLLVRRQQP